MHTKLIAPETIGRTPRKSWWNIEFELVSRAVDALGPTVSRFSKDMDTNAWSRPS